MRPLFGEPGALEATLERGPPPQPVVVPKPPRSPRDECLDRIRGAFPAAATLEGLQIDWAPYHAFERVLAIYRSLIVDPFREEAFQQVQEVFDADTPVAVGAAPSYNMG